MIAVFPAPGAPVMMNLLMRFLQRTVAELKAQSRSGIYRYYLLTNTPMDSDRGRMSYSIFDMRTIAYLLAAGLIAAGADAEVLPVVPGDSSRGAKLFETEQCIRCHAVNGRGGKVGLDLGRVVNREYRPAHLASAMWNHAPTMWAAMEGAGIETPKLTPEGAADLFAFFYSARFFDRSGQAAAGKSTF